MGTKPNILKETVEISNFERRTKTKKGLAIALVDQYLHYIKARFHNDRHNGVGSEDDRHAEVEKKGDTRNAVGNEDG